jgi:hypothetical protein
MNFVLSFLGISETDVDAEMNNDGSRSLADADVPSMPSGDSNQSIKKRREASLIV